MALTALSDAAFDYFRTAYPTTKPVPLSHQELSQMTQMMPQDGLQVLQDGPAARTSATSVAPQISEVDDRSNISLWVVRPTDVVHARENCVFGESVHGRKVKHSNLTGGNPAHCAGEILFHSDVVVVINGDSGRFGPRSIEEMNAVEIAFAKSGYEAWTTGWDSAANKPVPFFVLNLLRVSA
jgi:hypothetical protein